MPPKTRPARAPDAPMELVRLADRAAAELLGQMLRARPDASAALVGVPPICTGREGGMATWRISVNLDVVVPDTGAKGAADARG